MAVLVIVNKETGRLVFARDAAFPSFLHGLWSPVAYNYLLLVEAMVPNELRSAPWHWAFAERKLQKLPLTEGTEEHELNRRRADLLCILARALTRHRRVACKDELLGQQRIYDQLVAEARLFKQRAGAQPANYRFLTQAAEINGITVAQAATLVLMRHQQELDVLLDTEHRRRVFERQILAAVDAQALTEVERQLLEYERNG